MSLILEALRKSEAERRRGSVPNLHAELPPTPVVTRLVPRRAIWLAAAGVLLVTGLLIIRGAKSPDRPVPAAPKPADARTSATPVLQPLQHLSPAPAPAERQPPTHVDSSLEKQSPPRVAADVKPATETLPQALMPSPGAPIASKAVAPAETPSSEAGADRVMALSDLSAGERKALPPLKMSMHLWNDVPAQRFVIIDGNRLHEGDRIGDAVVTAIATDGVILDWNGRRLKLPIR